MDELFDQIIITVDRSRRHLVSPFASRTLRLYLNLSPINLYGPVDLNKIADLGKNSSLLIISSYQLRTVNQEIKRMKRSKDMIISQILEICAGGASKTRIVYQANLNFRTVNPYIELLTKNELLSVTSRPTVTYTTTQKGLKMLKEFKSIHSELPELYDTASKEQ